MRAILRGMMVWGALVSSLVLAPAIASAQNAAEPPPASPPATDTVGPRELQNFSLPGTTTRPAEQPPASATTPPAPQPKAAPPAPQPKAAPPARQADQPTTTAKAPEPKKVAPSPAPAVQRAPAPAPQSATTPSFDLPPPSATPAPALASSAPPPLSTPAPTPTLAPERGPGLLPWLLAAIALAAGALFFLWRRRPRAAYPGGGEFDLFAAPEPAPPPKAAPEPAPAARAASPVPRAAPEPPTPAPPKPAAPVGIVATRLRPQLEITIEPLRCLVGDDQVVIEFAIDLFNAGTAPARAVLAEASLLNAGGMQEQELAAFFANPVGAGDRLDAIQPLGRVQLTSYVVAPRAAVQEYELAGRKAFVPVIALNALYEWSGRKAQASAAFLVGRETKSDKLGPLHLDSGASEIRGLGSRVLPTALRT